MQRNTTMNAALFGGALFAAGIAHAAPQIEYQPGSYATWRVQSSGYGSLSLTNPAYPPYGWLPYSGDFPGNITIIWSADETEMGFLHDRHPTTSLWDQYSITGFLAYFNVTQDCPATMQWAAGTWGDSQATLRDLTLGVTLIAGDDDPVGWEQIALEEGHTYLLVMSSWGFATPGGGSMARFAVGSYQCNDADIDHNGVINLDDIQAFVDNFLGGCSAPTRSAAPSVPNADGPLSGLGASPQAPAGTGPVRTGLVGSPD